MAYQMRDSSGAHQDLPHFAQFVLGLLRCDTTNSKATVGVIDLTEILSGLVNADDIHKTSGAGYSVGTLPSILINCCLQICFTSSPVREYCSLPARGGRGWPRSKHTGRFIQQPMLWSCSPLQMLLGTTSQCGARHRERTASFHCSKGL